MNPIPSLLNFTRSINPTNGAFYYVRDGKKHPVLVSEATSLGTMSAYANGHKGNKDDDSALAHGNPKLGDVCFLPPDVNEFHVSFGISFTAQSLAPGDCNDPEVASLFESLASAYRDKGGYRILAERYMNNIVNARWLWRNRYADDKVVTISVLSGDNSGFSIDFEVGFDFDLKFDSPASSEAFSKLVDICADALSGVTGPARMDVVCRGRGNYGEIIYPSQEFLASKDSSKDAKQKVLFSFPYGDARQAGLHEQKIGNAVRTIDVWYSDQPDSPPLAVDPYCVERRRNVAHRLPKNKNDLYSYLKDLGGMIEQVETVAGPESIPGHVHFVMACLIRGGVYSGAKTSKK